MGACVCRLSAKPRDVNKYFQNDRFCSTTVSGHAPSWQAYALWMPLELKVIVTVY